MTSSDPVVRFKGTQRSPTTGFTAFHIIRKFIAERTKYARTSEYSDCRSYWLIVGILINYKVPIHSPVLNHIAHMDVVDLAWGLFNSFQTPP